MQNKIIRSKSKKVHIKIFQNQLSLKGIYHIFMKIFKELFIGQNKIIAMEKTKNLEKYNFVCQKKKKTLL